MNLIKNKILNVPERLALRLSGLSLCQLEGAVGFLQFKLSHKNKTKIPTE